MLFDYATEEKKKEIEFCNPTLTLSNESELLEPSNYWLCDATFSTAPNLFSGVRNTKRLLMEFTSASSVNALS